MLLPPSRALGASLLALSPAFLLCACDAFDSKRSESNDESSESAQALASDQGGFATLREVGQGGSASTLGLVEAVWGRRVDLWVLDAADGRPRPWLAGVVVGADLASVADEIVRDLSLATGRERLIVQHAWGSAGALAVLRELERGLQALDGALVPSNAVVSLRFDDLLDPARLVGGVALTLDGAPIAAARLALDSARGVTLDGVHFSARAVLELDPRAPAAGELGLDVRGVSNLAGRAAAGSPSLVFRTSASEALDNGVPPFVVGRLDGQLTQVVPGPTQGTFLVDFQFDAQACAFAPQLGDVLQDPAHTVEVVGVAGPVQGASTGLLRVQMVLGNPQTFAPGAAQLLAGWDSELGVPPACFVRFSPPAGVLPATDVSTSASAVIQFSEAMQPWTVQSTATFTIAHTTTDNPLKQLVPAAAVEDPTLDRFVLNPRLPLRHRQGQTERYRVHLADGPNGVTDFGGTPLEQALPDFEFTLAAAQPDVLSDGLTYTFEGLDEDGDLLPDLRGQMFYDLGKGLIGGRPVQRFTAVLDDSQPMVDAMVPVATGLQTPLVPLGAKQMSVWRHVDMGLALLDDFLHNLDVEGLHWAPMQPVVGDAFQAFQLSLGHGHKHPDEVLNFLVPQFRFSGLTTTYDDNVLGALEVVHDKSAGYQIQPADSFVSATGTLLHPWPLNQNIPLSEYRYWTWRDTAVLEVGGATGGTSSGIGADPLRLGQVTASPGLPGFYPKGMIPTIGEPLLMEFRTYPDASALGVNTLRSSIAINSSYRPAFRAYSAGGVDATGQSHLIDPDNEPVATGGYSSFGSQTGPIDNVVNWGGVDFVMRVSRAHTRWLDTGAAHDFATFPVVEYGPAGLAPGTQVRLAYRGASSVSAPVGTPWLDGKHYDPYGDGYTQDQLDTLFGLASPSAFHVVEFPTDDDKSWHDSLDLLDGARWIQVRVTFVANPVTLDVPQLAGLALAWQ